MVEAMKAIDLTDQTAVVTGGTRGIGAAISRAMLAAGARVLATYHTGTEQAQRFAARCEQELGAADRLSLHSFDVADSEAVARFFGELSSGGLEILVNNSGTRQDALLGLMSQQAWERVLAVNLTGAFNMCKLAVRAMMPARYGRIVSITSPSGRLGFAGQSNYAAAKSGLVALTRSLAREVARRGITVNCVCPGFVLTDLIKDLPQEKLDAFKADVPMGRFGEPDEVAAAVLFLASRQASYITGAVLDVTGGI
jgi:3-oxoacyl-[acyl-carrier protein] reductase